MSVEITIYSLKATKEELRQTVKNFGFVKCNSIYKEPKENLGFMYFESEDYKSTNGIELTIYKPDKSEIEKFGAGEWAVHTRVRAGGSEFDQKMQNKIIKILKDKFGGVFYNDCDGKNRYRTIEKDKRKPMGRGIALLYEKITDRFSSIYWSLPNEIPIKGKNKIAVYLSHNDPNRILYNALLPFIVAGIENFFTGVFFIIFQYSEIVKRKLELYSGKVNFFDVLEVSKGNKTLADIIMQDYSFQNLNSINKAFNQWLDIDFKRAIHFKPHGKRKTVELVIEDIIKKRHQFVHEFYFDYDLNKIRLLKIINSALHMFYSFIEYLEKEKNILIFDDYLRRYKKIHYKYSQFTDAV